MTGKETISELLPLFFKGMTCLLIYVMFSCTMPDPKDLQVESPAGEMLNGEHVLRRFNVSSKTEQNIKGSYFLIAGQVESNTISKYTATFAWKTHDDTYITTELPLSKIRVKIDSTANQPYVKFRWRPCNCTLNDINNSNSIILYMVVHCKEEDYPLEINL